MLSAAEISATTLACPSMAQLMRSTSTSGARRTYNSGMAINRRPHAAFSAHAADPMASTTPASSSDSNTYIHATTPLDADRVEELSTGTPRRPR